MRSPRPMRTSLPPGVAARLRNAPTRELRQLVEEHARTFTPRDVGQVLRNPFVTAEIIEEISAVRHLRAVYAVQRAVARHRRTPQVVAQRALAHLYWRDLNEITLDVQIHPAVRRSAANILAQRLPRLAVGEKITLARRTASEVIVHLRDDPDQRVIAALLENSRLTEDLVVPLVAGSASPRILDLVAQSLWGRRYEVRLALARNPASPLRAVLAVLPTLRRGDLRTVAEIEEHSTFLRRRALDLLGIDGAPQAGMDAGIDPEEGFDPSALRR